MNVKIGLGVISAVGAVPLPQPCQRNKGRGTFSQDSSCSSLRAFGGKALSQRKGLQEGTNSPSLRGFTLLHQSTLSPQQLAKNFQHNLLTSLYVIQQHLSQISKCLGPVSPCRYLYHCGFQVSCDLSSLNSSRKIINLLFVQLFSYYNGESYALSISLHLSAETGSLFVCVMVSF